jgi:hypothetical protein
VIGVYAAQSELRIVLAGVLIAQGRAPEHVPDVGLPISLELVCDAYNVRTL